MAKRKLSQEQQRAYVEQQMNRPINPTGEGESEAVKALLSPEFEQMSNLNATDIALLLQQIIKGQESILAKTDENSLEIARLREHQAKVDARMEQSDNQRKREIDDILNRAEKLKLTGEARDKIIAKGGQMFTEAVQQAKANHASDRLVFEQALKNMPTETIVSPGQWEQTREGPRLVPEVIRIKHKTWILEPGIPQEVPQIVAERLRNIRKSQAETAARKQILGKQMEQHKMVEAWNKVEGSAESMPLA